MHQNDELEEIVTNDETDQMKHEIEIIDHKMNRYKAIITQNEPKMKELRVQSNELSTM